MKNYLRLQFTMTNRRFNDAGLTPWVAYPLLALGFVAVSLLLFQKTEHAQYAYMLISLVLTAKLSEVGRNEFLQLCFKKREVLQLRFIENLMVAVPFMAFLLYKQLFLSAVLLAVLSALLAAARVRTVFHFTLPTPFYKRPFEYAVGFRNTFYLFLVAYALTIIAVSVHSINLGLFSMVLIAGVCLGYYTKPEPEYYVWNCSISARHFLLEKVRTALLYATLLQFPLVLILSTFFMDQVDRIALCLLACYAFLVCTIAAKYSAYPNEMSVPQGILIAISLYFPPLLMLVIPYFFVRSIHRLKVILIK